MTMCCSMDVQTPEACPRLNMYEIGKTGEKVVGGSKVKENEQRNVGSLAFLWSWLLHIHTSFSDRGVCVMLQASY